MATSVQDSTSITPDQLLAMQQQANEQLFVQDRINKYYENPDAFVEANGRGAVYGLADDAKRVGLNFDMPTTGKDVALTMLNEVVFGLPGLVNEDVRNAEAYAPAWAKAAGIGASLISGGFLAKQGMRIAGKMLLKKAAQVAAGEGAVLGAEEAAQALRTFRETGALPSAKVLREIERNLPSKEGGTSLSEAWKYFKELKDKKLGNIIGKSRMRRGEEMLAELDARAQARTLRRAAQSQASVGAPRVRVGSRMTMADKLRVMDRFDEAATSGIIRKAIGMGAGVGVGQFLPSAERYYTRHPGGSGQLDRFLAAGAAGAGEALKIGGMAAGGGVVGLAAPRVGMGIGAYQVAHGTLTKDPEEAMMGLGMLLPSVKMPKGAKLLPDRLRARTGAGPGATPATPVTGGGGPVAPVGGAPNPQALATPPAAPGVTVPTAPLPNMPAPPSAAALRSTMPLEMPVVNVGEMRRTPSFNAPEQQLLRARAARARLETHLQNKPKGAKDILAWNKERVALEREAKGGPGARMLEHAARAQESRKRVEGLFDQVRKHASGKSSSNIFERTDLAKKIRNLSVQDKVALRRTIQHNGLRGLPDWVVNALQ